MNCIYWVFRLNWCGNLKQYPPFENLPFNPGRIKLIHLIEFWTSLDLTPQIYLPTMVRVVKISGYCRFVIDCQYKYLLWFFVGLCGCGGCGGCLLVRLSMSNVLSRKLDKPFRLKLQRLAPFELFIQLFFYYLFRSDLQYELCFGRWFYLTWSMYCDNVVWSHFEVTFAT